MGPAVLGRLVSSTFDKKKMIPHSEFSPGTVKLLYIFLINLGLDVGRDIK